MKKKPLNLLIIAILCLTSCNEQFSSSDAIKRADAMAITLTAVENRPVSFSNKEAAFYYTQSHENSHPEYSYFQGLTIEQKRVFSGYSLSIDNKYLERSLSTVDVYPYKMVRRYAEGVQETCWMADSLNLMAIDVKGVEENKTLALHLRGLLFDTLVVDTKTAYFRTVAKTNAHPNFWIAVAPQKPVAISVKQGRIRGKGTQGFLIAVARKKIALSGLIKQGLSPQNKWRDIRKNRIAQLVSNRNTIVSSNDTLQQALRWLTVTTDQLVSHQRGYGIYAGLPWFSEYWGRDEFISLPGACLVSGNLDVARKILLSFAQHQDTVFTSPFYGRVPNIVKVGSEDFHTTDGTPRFVIELLDYIKYSGDTEIIKELYPYVKRSIIGSLKNWTDEKGYLLHKDNETWMDARRDSDKVAYSPRATRANDIQALWYQQLLAGVYFAREMQDEKNAQRWQEVADHVSFHFDHDFTSSIYPFIADHVDSLNVAHYELRPNQLFAFDLIHDEGVKARALKQCWEQLVYPWGTATLNQQDPFFHPYHIAWEHYHKDEAYHNGTVWPWLNGIVMQRMLEFNQIEPAFELFQNSNKQVLYQGCVGGLSENLDAHPKMGSLEPNVTGAYLQAWSNAEQLRVWSQYFLGIRPDLLRREVLLAPRLPQCLQDLKVTSPLGKGQLHFQMESTTRERFYTYTVQDFKGVGILDIYPFAVQKIELNPQTTVKVEVREEEMMLIIDNGIQGKKSIALKPLKVRMELQSYLDAILGDVTFCQPDITRNYPVLQ